MAKKEKDSRFTYQMRHGYKSHPYVHTKEEDPEYFKKITEPGQAISIKKLVERYEKNRRRQTDFGTL